MAQNSAQRAFTIKRLRHGITISIAIDDEGGPRWQGVDEKSGTVTPDWTTDVAKRPILRPKAVKTQGGNQVPLSFHQWLYNGVILLFTGAETDGWKTDSTGTFKMETATGKLTIIKNLASLTNIAGDTLTYKGIATANGEDIALEKTIDIIIQPVGANAYVGFLETPTTTLDSENTQVTVKTRLTLGGSEEITSYHTKWFKDDQEWTAMAGQKNITIKREDIDTFQLIIVKFYKDSTPGAKCLTQCGAYFEDTMDEFNIEMDVTSANTEIDTGKPVTARFYVSNVTSGLVQAIKNPQWDIRVMDSSDWSVKRYLKNDEPSSVASGIGTFTTADTDDPTTGEILHEIPIHVEVEFDI